MTPAERGALRRLATARSTPQAVARRARLVLSCADGLTDAAAARREGVSRPTAARWRTRFATGGLDALTDRPRSGRPRVIGDTHLHRLRTAQTTRPPAPATTWSTRALARATGLSQTTVSRLLRGARPSPAAHAGAPGPAPAPARPRPAPERTRATPPPAPMRGTPRPAPPPASERNGTYDSARLRVEPQLADVVVYALRAEIAGGRYHAGERITESALATRLGVSRGPIRDALRVLAEDGLVELLPNRGAVVPHPQVTDIIETYATRAVLGSLLVRRVTARTPEVLAPVGAALADVRAAARQDDHRRTADADLRFQDAVARAADLPRASTFFVRLTMQLRMFVAVLGLDYADSRDIIIDHDTAIFEALCTQSPGRAASRWRTKIDHAVRTMIDQIPAQSFNEPLWQTVTIPPR